MTDSDTAGPQSAPVGSLFDAVREGDAKRARSLLDAGADLAARDEDEWCALDWAAGRGDIDMVRLLLGAGADPAAVGGDQRRPHDIALAAGHVAVARLLRDAADRANPTAEPDHAWRPYCRAYSVADLRRYPQWPEDVAARAGGSETAGAADDPEVIVFLHDDLTVTSSMWPGEDVLFDAVTEQWAAFCATELGFTVPDELDLVPPAGAPGPGAGLS